MEEYDIFLFSGTHAKINSKDLSQLGTQDADIVRSRIQQSKSGFLGIHLPKQNAVALLNAIIEVHGRGIVVPVVYRQPKVSIEGGLRIAYSYFISVLSVSPIRYTPPIYRSEHPLWWEYFCEASDLVDQGYVLGGHFILVDKIDGHIWTPESIAQYVIQINQWTSLRLRDRYDVFLPLACPNPPTTGGGPAASYLADPEIQRRLLQKRPGLVCCNLPIKTGFDFLAHVHSAGGWALLIPSEYQHPLVTQDTAQQIAGSAIENQKNALYPDLTFGPLEYSSESPVSWIFRVQRGEVRDGQNQHPRRVVSEIDKLDGHIWREGEHNSYNELFSSNGLSRLDRLWSGVENTNGNE